MKNEKVFPTVFVKKGEDFKVRFNKITPLAKRIQIDFMDGEFVKTKSIDISEIPDLSKFTNEFDAHLMVKFPQNYIADLSSKGFTRAIFHYETKPLAVDTKYMIALIQRYDMEPIIALSPETSTHVLADFKGLVKEILLLGVNPGKEGQKFIEGTLQRIGLVKDMGFIVSVDGGINYEVAAELKKAGCDHIYSGSFVSNSDSPKEVMEKLLESFEKGPLMGKKKKNTESTKSSGKVNLKTERR